MLSGEGIETGAPKDVSSNKLKALFLAIHKVF